MVESQETAARLKTIRERIDAACARAGRMPAEVELMAVSKTVAPERIQRAIDAGARTFGENRVQEAGAGIVSLGGLYADPIGALRRSQNRRPEVSA